MGIRSQNNPAASYLDKWLATGNEASVPIKEGHTASGGLISDYTDPGGDIFRAHVFETSGTFTLTSLGSYPAHIEYLVVGGGGAGGYEGGGGAGGVRTNCPEAPAPLRAPNTNFPVSISPGSYTVTVGGGGFGGGQDAGNNNGRNDPANANATGSSSSLASPTAPETINS